MKSNAIKQTIDGAVARVGRSLRRGRRAQDDQIVAVFTAGDKQYFDLGKSFDNLKEQQFCGGEAACRESARLFRGAWLAPTAMAPACAGCLPRPGGSM